MAERIDLSTPYGPQTTVWRVYGIHLSRGLAGDLDNPNESFVEVFLAGDNGQRKEHRWHGASTDADIIALNKANLSTKSLHKRIMEKLIADGVIAGTISGTPD